VHFNPRRVFDRHFLRTWELVRHRLQRVASRQQSLNHQIRILRTRRERLFKDRRS
jgi:hypothetical protein